MSEPMKELMIAIESGMSNSSVEFAISKVPDLNKGVDLENPLLKCMWGKNNYRPDYIKLLIKGGADPNYKSAWGTTPLMFLFQMGLTELVDFMIEHGADPKYVTDNNEKNTILTFAERNGDVNLINLAKRHFYGEQYELMKQIQELQAELKEYYATYDFMDKTIIQLKTEKRELEEHNETLSAEIDELGATVRQYVKTDKFLNVKIISLEEEKRKLEAYKSESDIENSALNQNCIWYEKNQIKLMAERDEFEVKYKLLNEKIIPLEAEKTELEAEIKELEVEFNVQNEARILNEEIKSKLSAKNRALEAEKMELDAKYKLLLEAHEKTSEKLQKFMQLLG